MNLSITVGKSKNETRWQQETRSWEDLCTVLSHAVKTKETMAEYQAMSKLEKGAAKDRGGFVGGVFNGSQRKNESLLYRSLIALDIDFGEQDTPEEVETICDLNGWECLMHTTHSHTEEEPRYRLFLPLSRNVTREEYEPIARKIADQFGIELFDDTTYQAARMMFWPTVSSDGIFESWRFHGDPVDADELLSEYDDWRDQKQWSFSSRHKREIHQSAERQKDPRSKGGIVGAFCRVYDIYGAIEKYLSDVYTPTEDDTRWTYAGGSTVGGLVVYDDGLFAYSHHDTDPASGMLCNAFDLVGVHKFPGCDSKDRHERMKAVCAADEAVRHMLDTISAEAIADEFKDAGPADDLKRLDDDFTEQGNALRMVDKYYNEMRYAPSLGWCVYDGEVWQTKEDDGLARMKLMNLADDMTNEADRALQLAPVPDKKLPKKEWPPEYLQALERVKWAKQSRNARNQANTLSVAQAVLRAKDDEFDADTGIINTPIGVVDLKSSSVRMSRAHDYCTMITAVGPDWEQPHPLWDGFLHGITGGDQAYADYLQRVAGMALYGKVYEEGLVIAYGSGSNGKSTLFDLWVRLMGSYADVVRNEVIMGNRNGGDVAGQNLLRGKRLVIMGELENNQTMQGAILKRLTSHDRIQANVKYYEPITFTPSHTLILHTNHLPRLQDVDAGTVRRIAVAPFTMTITPERKITGFGDMLFEQEGPAVLAWMLDGARLFAEDGYKLTPPQVVREATAEYVDQEDVIGTFLRERCTLEGNAECKPSEMFDAFAKWLDANKLGWKGGSKGFKAALLTRGFEYVKRHGEPKVLGIRLEDDTFIDEL